MNQKEQADFNEISTRINKVKKYFLFNFRS